jgi:branched-chain amino acid transport system ATP-binding protein
MGLAPLLVDQIFAAIQALKRDGVTVFLVEQNAAAALDIADRGYLIETGRIVHEGQARAMLADERLRKAYLGV